MGEVYFYHLTASPLEQTLPMLLSKARGAGWRVLVRGTAPDRMGWLNDRLWLGNEATFLAHGLSGGEFDADQPILLTCDGDNPNSSDCLMSVDGAEVSPAEVQKSARVCILFDGNDPVALERARGQWKSLADAGSPAQYWAQEDGKWTMKARSHSTD